MEKSANFNIVPKPPEDFLPYLVTFNEGDIHPFDKISMRNRAVRIFAPSFEKAMEVCQFRFGSRFAFLKSETEMAGAIYSNGMWETLIWRTV